MKPATFKEVVVLYEGMIVNQIKKLGIRQDFEDVEIRVKDFMSVLDEKEKYIIFERFFVGKTMGEIALETEMTYYQVRWMYRQALEKMRDSVRG